MIQDKYRKQVAPDQRGGDIRIVSSKQIVFELAVFVVEWLISIDPLAQEKNRVYERRDVLTRIKAEEEAGMFNIRQRYRRYESGTRVRWTARFIANIAEWTNCDHGEVCYVLHLL